MNIFEQRIKRVQERLSTWKVDAVLISSPVNRRWLTGFTGSFGYVVITENDVTLAADGRYWTQVDQECPFVTLYRYKRVAGALRKLIESFGIDRIGLEAEHVTLATYSQLRKAEGKTFVALSGSVEDLRCVKSAEEIAAIRAAAAITDEAMNAVNTIAQVGMTEKQLAWALEKRMRENGADALAFSTIVAAGPNGSKPHHRASDRPLAIGDAITIDMGAKLNGFNSDLTRTFHLGDSPSDQFWDVYNTVLDAETSSIEQMQAGMTGAQIDAIARDIITDAGYGDYFLHTLGHGVGLEVHEGPKLSYVNEDNPIPVGSIVTVEPGIYLPDWSGVRIEDLVLVNENGAEAISQCPKNPIIPTSN